MASTTTGIFEGGEMSSELFSTWIKRKEQITRERLQPYADLLLDNIVWPSILAKKAEIFSSLKAKCGTANHASELSVPIWSFSHVHEYPRGAAPPGGPPHAYALERGDAVAQRVQKIHQNGWHQWLSVEDEDEYPVLERAFTWDIMRKTDFCEQLAIRFGTDFRVSVIPQAFKTEKDPSGETYHHREVNLSLGYFPFGLPEYHQKSRGEFLEAFAGRQRRTLRSGEKLTYWAGEDQETTVYGPPLPVPLLGRGWQIPDWSVPEERPSCHCGYHCGYDSGESEE
jgi:hypothetical protein